MENKNKKVDNNNLKNVEKNKINQILKDINYWLEELDDKIDYFVADENWKEEDEENELTKEDFVFVIKNKIEELKKLLEMGEKNEK